MAWCFVISCDAGLLQSGNGQVCACWGVGVSRVWSGKDDLTHVAGLAREWRAEERPED